MIKVNGAGKKCGVKIFKLKKGLSICPIFPVFLG